MSNSMTPKTKKDLHGLRPISSVSWRKLKKGQDSNRQPETEKLKPTLKIGAYIRLSPTSDDRDEGSLVSHPQRINQFVDLKNSQAGDVKWGEIAEWYVDKDLSGKDMDRPSFQRMLRDIKIGRINAVIITELSRLNRKVRDFCEVWEFFKAQNVKLISLKESFDTSTPMGELMLIQSMSFAQFERQTIVDRIKKGAKARAERGLGNGIVSLGFKLSPNRPNHREIDPQEKEIVEMIFRKFLELKKLAPLLSYLIENGYRTKEFVSKEGKKIGGNRWTMSTLYYLLTNRAYIGEREINKKNRAIKASELIQDEQYSVAHAQWSPVISKDLFESVQRLLEENRKRARKTIHQYRLTGFIECEECGQTLIGKSGSGRNEKYFYYGHKRKMLAQKDGHLKRCKIENIPALLIEEAVIERFQLLSQDRRLLVKLVSSSHSEKLEKLEHQKSLLGVKEQERRKLESQYKNLIESLCDADELSLRDDIKKMAREVKAQLVACEEGIISLKSEVGGIRDNVIDLNQALGTLRVFKGGFRDQPVSVQAEVLRDILKRVIIRPEVIVLEFYVGKPVVLEHEEIVNKKELPAGPSRSVTLPDFNLVDLIGIEPMTPSLQS